VRHFRADFGTCLNPRETLLIQGKTKAAEDCRTPKRWMLTCVPAAKQHGARIVQHAGRSPQASTRQSYSLLL